MRIETVEGKYGKNDKKILVTTTNKKGGFCVREPITIFKLGVLLNQITFNELQLKDGYKKKLLRRGEKLFFEEAMKEAIEMAKKEVNWAERHNWKKVEDWRKKHNLKVENIESELKRTFQLGLDDYTQEKKRQISP